MMCLGVLAIFVWREYTATVANMMLVGILVYSFEPTVRGVWINPHKETPTAWYFWTVAYAITGVNTFLFKGGWTLSMVLPIVGCICHGIVPVLCSERRKQEYVVVQA